tara:strand:+ start:39 stop:398 length:360 start_codon:yes stop_codon:yes gene_type:complete
MCSKGFTVDDLTNMLNIIEICTKRGAFQASELSGLGTFYDKLKLCKDSLSQNEVSDKCVGGKCEQVQNEGENEVQNEGENEVQNEGENGEENEVQNEGEKLEEVCDGGKCYLSPTTVCV